MKKWSTLESSDLGQIVIDFFGDLNFDQEIGNLNSVTNLNVRLIEFEDDRYKVGFEKNGDRYCQVIK